jgi:hypothetical protein
MRSTSSATELLRVHQVPFHRGGRGWAPPVSQKSPKMFQTRPTGSG